MDYACAAALALRHHPRADVLGMSMRRLPEFLLNVQGYEDITLLGIGLESNPALLETALARLAKRNVKIRWISALPLPETLPNSLREKLDTFVAGEGVLRLVEMVVAVEHLKFQVRHGQVPFNFQEIGSEEIGSDK